MIYYLACIDLIERQGAGILAMLDEEGQVPKGSDESLIKKLSTKHKPNSFFGTSLFLFLFLLLSSSRRAL